MFRDEVQSWRAKTHDLIVAMFVPEHVVPPHRYIVITYCVYDISSQGSSEISAYVRFGQINTNAETTSLIRQAAKIIAISKVLEVLVAHGWPWFSGL